MPARQIDPLTGVRFLAAMAVVLYHLQWKAAAAGMAWVGAVFGHGDLAVPFFFTLSGFILSHVYFPTYQVADHGNFIRTRFARLWPVHVAMLGAMMLYVGALTVARGYIPAAKYDFTAIIPELAMVRSWYDGHYMWNGPAWSIHVEWFAYTCLFPLCAIAVRRLGQPWVIAGAIVAVAACQPLIALPGLLSTIVCPFIIGSLAYQLKQALPAFRHGGAVTIAGVIAIPVAIATGSLPLCYLAFTATIFGLAYEQGLIARLLATRPLVYGGEISFSLYMSHIVVNTWGWELWVKTRQDGQPWTIPVTIAISLLTAAAVHHWIEVPANKWLRPRKAASRPLAAPLTNTVRSG